MEYIISFDKIETSNKIKEIIKKNGVNQAALCRELKIPPTVLSTWLRAGFPDIEKLYNVVEKMGIKLDDVLVPLKTVKLKNRSTLIIEERQDADSDDIKSDFVLIPKISLKGSAGNGYFIEIDGEQVVDHYSFKQSWLKSEGLYERNLRLITADGSSMEPTIIHKDICLIDLSDISIRKKSIFLIRHNNLLQIKRLERKETGEIVKISDNKEFLDEEIKQEQHDQDFSIIGRVVWIGRSLN